MNDFDMRLVFNLLQGFPGEAILWPVMIGLMALWTHFKKGKDHD